MPKRLLLTLVLFLHCTLSGCAPAFIAAGAGAGYLATHEDSRRKVGLFFQDLNRSIQKTTRKIYDEQWTSRQMAYSTNSGFILKIRKMSLTPGTVNKGEKVKLIVEYVVMGGPEKGASVEEKQSLFSGGKELTVLNNQTTTKENGTWENTLTFAVPDSADPGKYTVIQVIKAKGLTRTARRSFTIR